MVCVTCFETLYLQALKWHVVVIDSIHVVYRYIPFVGGLAKMQRPDKLPAMGHLLSVLQKNRIRTIAIEPSPEVTQNVFSKYILRLKQSGVKIYPSAFLPTKTIQVDLTPGEDQIFSSLSEAKRRAVRRALKNDVRIIESDKIADFISIKNKSAGLFGFITTYGIDKFWPIFAPNHAKILLASCRGTTVGGILLVFWGRIAYYWMAGATKSGKKLFAPTLLVWEALKCSRLNRCTKFDFVGVWDERMPKNNKEWLGFTKFKEGFGGKPLYYPISMLRR
jgi:hypothetical protein